MAVRFRSQHPELGQPAEVRRLRRGRDPAPATGSPGRSGYPEIRDAIELRVLVQQAAAVRAVQLLAPEPVRQQPGPTELGLRPVRGLRRELGDLFGRRVRPILRRPGSAPWRGRSTPEPAPDRATSRRPGGSASRNRAIAAPAGSATSRPVACPAGCGPMPGPRPQSRDREGRSARTPGYEAFGRRPIGRLSWCRTGRCIWCRRRSAIPTTSPCAPSPRCAGST